MWRIQRKQSNKRGVCLDWCTTFC